MFKLIHPTFSRRWSYIFFLDTIRVHLNESLKRNAAFAFSWFALDRFCVRTSVGCQGSGTWSLSVARETGRPRWPVCGGVLVFHGHGGNQKDPTNQKNNQKRKWKRQQQQRIKGMLGGVLLRSHAARGYICSAYVCMYVCMYPYIFPWSRTRTLPALLLGGSSAAASPVGTCQSCRSRSICRDLCVCVCVCVCARIGTWCVETSVLKLNRASAYNNNKTRKTTKKQQKKKTTTKNNKKKEKTKHEKNNNNKKVGSLHLKVSTRMRHCIGKLSM